MKKVFLLIISLIMLAACDGTSSETGNPNYDKNETSSGNLARHIYLYGEQHGLQKYMDREFEVWHDYYIKENMRHLFIEISYPAAEFLNIWMKSDSDDMLDAVYNDLIDTQAQVPYTKEFYKMIKKYCTETIFHGTDIGHQHNTTGERYLKYLEDNNLKDSEQYKLAVESNEQGKYYQSNYGNTNIYRENKISENFIREFDKLNGESGMGIYGAAHIYYITIDFADGSVPSVATQLKENYGDVVNVEFLFVATININGKDYEAPYFGEHDISQFGLDYIKREFWRLENAYDDFKDRETIDNLPYGNYPMTVETGQVFVIDYTKKDGAVDRMYYRSDGTIFRDNPSTVGFIP